MLPSRYEGIGIKDMREFLDNSYPYVYQYLPEPNIELPKVPKQWFANVCATLLQEKFSQWVKERCDYRHTYVVKKGNQNIEMDEEMAEKFRQSKAISSKWLSFYWLALNCLACH